MVFPSSADGRMASTHYGELLWRFLFQSTDADSHRGPSSSEFASSAARSVTRNIRVILYLYYQEGANPSRSSHIMVEVYMVFKGHTIA